MTQGFLPGRMQVTPLTLRMIFDRMRTVHGDGRVIGHDGTFTYAEAGERILRMARVLVEDLGVEPGDRVASFGFNSARHFELYYAVPLVGAVLHTVNVRLFDEQIAYIVNHAEDKVVFVDDELLGPLAEVAPAFTTVERYVRLAPGEPSGELPGLLDGDELLAGADPYT
ncbi:MAG: AMP-binding protein, partial [Nitriliruptorales bacterium]|nr:AMP-binding protein [Nitriliruptorales bacterium]